MITTNRMREIADLDSRSGAPVGCALCAAADRIDELEAALMEIISMDHKEQGAHGIVVAQRIARIAMRLPVKKRVDFDDIRNSRARR